MRVGTFMNISCTIDKKIMEHYMVAVFAANRCKNGKSLSKKKDHLKTPFFTADSCSVVVLQM